MAWVTMIGASDAQVEYRLTGGHGCGTVVTVDAAPLIEAVQNRAEEKGVTVSELLGSREAKRSFFRARSQLRGTHGEARYSGGDAMELAAAASLDAAVLYPGVHLQHAGGGDGRLDYRLDANERPLVWIGSGLGEFGIEAGSVLAPIDFAAARRLMHGEDPRTGRTLVEPKVAVAPEAKLPAAPALEAIERVAAQRGVEAVELFDSQRKRDLYGRMNRQVRRFGASHRTPVSPLLRLAEATGVDAVALYGEQAVEDALRAEEGGRLDVRPLLAAAEVKAREEGCAAEELFASRAVRRRFVQCRGEAARRLREVPVAVREAVGMAKAAGLDPHRVWDAEEVTAALLEGRVEVGNRGADVTLDLPKSHSVLLAYADPGTAAEIEDVYTACGREAIAALEGWTAYAMRGRHGDGHSAETVGTSGFSGWMMVHRAARPVGDATFGDPHFHLHFTLANLVRGEDGPWSTVAAGGRDLHRHAKATQAVMSARVRHELHHRFGIDFRRDERTRAWEIAGIPQSSIRLFSKRDSQVRDLLHQLGIDYDTATLKERTHASATSKAAKNPDAAGASDDVLRAHWQAEARTASADPRAIAADVHHHHRPDRPGNPSIEELCAAVFDPQYGLTAHAKEFTHATAIAAVLDALPHGIADTDEAERLTRAVLGHAGYAVPLAPIGAQHYAHADRYTTADVLAAEERILTQATTRRDEGTALVDRETVEMTLALTEAQRGPGFAFSDEQRAVLHRLLTGGHGIDVVLGVAGAGKTTIMDTARTAWQAQGQTVAGASTAAVACANLTAEAGIPARTLASWLTSLRGGGPGLAGVDVLVVDEAAMCDDRDLAELLTHAADTGTKVVGIGDPKQLRSPGIGGSFTAVHQLLDGLALTENHRQRDAVERRALAMWRDDQRTDALRTLAGHGRVHALEDKDATVAAMLTLWADKRAAHDGDDHAALQDLLMLSATNEVVDELNLGARALRKHRGELTGPDHLYRLHGGGDLVLSVGDQVLLRTNDYRSRTSNGAHADVLNGHRGIVRAVDGQQRVLVEWREQQPDGERDVAEWVTPDYVAEGGLTLGYAITGHKSQGLSVQEALVYGPGAQANALYTMLSRDRRESHLFLPLSAYEDDTDHGAPATEAERLDRAVAGLIRTVDTADEDPLMLTQLPHHALPEHLREMADILRSEPRAPWGDAPYGHLLAAALGDRLHRAEAAHRTAHDEETADHASARITALRDELHRRDHLSPNDYAAEEAVRRQTKRHVPRKAVKAPVVSNTPLPALYNDDVPRL